MKTAIRKLSLILLFAVPLLAVSACHQEGPAEKAGSTIDNVAQKMKDTIDPPGPVEKAGRAVDNVFK